MPSAAQLGPADTNPHTSSISGQLGSASFRGTAAAQPLAEVPCEVPPGPWQCCEGCQAHTSQLTAALLDANARVNVARAQLLAAQADMSMLLGKDLQASWSTVTLALPVLTFVMTIRPLAMQHFHYDGNF
jgi:hypothetical protein